MKTGFIGVYSVLKQT